MSTDIAGWVEIKRNEHWSGAVRIQKIIRRNYQMFDFLFGGRSDNYDEAIAGNRGIPDDISSEVEFCETWMGVEEIQAIDWEKHEDIVTNDWKGLFKIMAVLAEQDIIDDVRLIVHFC